MFGKYSNTIREFSGHVGIFLAKCYQPAEGSLVYVLSVRTVTEIWQMI